MKSPCRDFELLLSGRAAGALEAGELPMLEAHLAGCEACRAEAQALAEAVELARLPPLAEGEIQGLESRILASWSRSERRRNFGRRIAVGVAVAAAAAAMILAPGALRHAPQIERATHPAAWQGPDLDELWADSAVAYPSADEEAALEERVMFASMEDAEPL